MPLAGLKNNFLLNFQVKVGSRGRYKIKVCRVRLELLQRHDSRGGPEKTLPGGLGEGRLISQFGYKE